MKAVERVTADPALHTPDLGGKATTKQVTDAVCEALRQANDCVPDRPRVDQREPRPTRGRNLFSCPPESGYVRFRCC